jgi:hypothetical protein
MSDEYSSYNEECRAKVIDACNKIDAAYPGWQYKINLDELAMCDHEKCVFGQLLGPFQYQQACTVLGIPQGVTANWPDMWKEQIIARRTRLGALKHRLGLYG